MAGRRTCLAALAALAARADDRRLPDALAVPGGVAPVELGAAARAQAATYDGKPAIVLADARRGGKCCRWLASR